MWPCRTNGATQLPANFTSDDLRGKTRQSLQEVHVISVLCASGHGSIGHSNSHIRAQQASSESPKMTDAARLKATIYVGGLDNAVDEKVLADAFLPFGEIVEVSLPKPDLPSSTDPHRGFGYVEFEIPGDANEAIDNMDQSEIFGRVIKVSAAKPQKASNEGLGSRTAVWEQVS